VLKHTVKSHRYVKQNTNAVEYLCIHESQARDFSIIDLGPNSQNILARMHDVVLVYAETSGYVGTSKSETS